MTRSPQNPSPRMRALEFVLDLVTLFWLLLFCLVLAGCAPWWAGHGLLAVGLVFGAELCVVFFRSSSWAAFLRAAWLDILFLIPFFRVFRALRAARVFRAARRFRGLRRAASRSGRLRRLLCARTGETCLEAADLLKEVFSRARGRLFRP